MLNTILVDLDNVLNDFDEAACRVHKVDYEQFKKVRKPGVWDLCHAFAEVLGQPDFSVDHFWQPIHNAGASFWNRIEPTPWAGELIELVESKVGDNWRIVTAPSRDETSYLGKVRWLKRRFGAAFDRFHITRHKHDFARQRVLLIDDSESNLDKFHAAGGRCLLFPHAGNMWHAVAANPLAYIRSDLSLWINMCPDVVK